MILLIFILIYILSVIGLLIGIYIIDTNCKTIGDILDKSEIFMYLPYINTIALIVLISGIIFHLLNKIIKLNKLWNKIRNIKLR